jgi:hypothetical protein
VALAGVGLLVAAVVAVIILSQTLGGSDEPPAAPAFVPPAVSTISALDVKQRAGDRIVVSLDKGPSDPNGGSRDLALTSGTRVEVLRAIDASGIRAGDQVTVVGIPNEVKNFSIRSIVVQSAAAGASGQAALSPGGFAGHEVSRLRTERPLAAGTVESVDGNTVVMKGAAGRMVLALDNAKLFRIEQGSEADIQEGDRVAGAFDGQGPLLAILVLPGGGTVAQPAK